jgi:hypothetical protein
LLAVGGASRLSGLAGGLNLFHSPFPSIAGTISRVTATIRSAEMVALCLASGLLTMSGGIGLFAYAALQWLSDGDWQPVALADYVGVPATRSLFGLNDLLQLAFGLPVGVDLIAIGVLALVVGRQLDRWRALSGSATLPGA